MTESTPSAVDDETLARIREIVVDELELDIPAADVDEDARFMTDYDGDSLSVIQIVARVERELRIPLPKDRLGEVDSLRDIRRLAADVAGGPGRG